MDNFPEIINPVYYIEDHTSSRDMLKALTGKEYYDWQEYDLFFIMAAKWCWN